MVSWVENNRLGVSVKEKRACRCSETRQQRDGKWEAEVCRGGGCIRERRKKEEKKTCLGNYRTRLGSWGNLSGTRELARLDHMEGGLRSLSPKPVTRLLPSPWAECAMRLARTNVLHVRHLCHKTNLINVNYAAATIRRGLLPHTNDTQ